VADADPNEPEVARAGALEPPVRQPLSRSTRPALVVGGVVAVGGIGAAAIAIFVASRSTHHHAPAIPADAATVVLSAPDTIGSLTSLGDTRFVIETKQKLTAAGGVLASHDHLVAEYTGNGGPERVVVLALKGPWTDADQEKAMSGASALVSAGGPVQLLEFPAGSLGGSFSCGTVAANMTELCVFSDPDAVGWLLVGNADTDPVTVARAVREAIEHRG
jgi:hypothetical protein